MKRLSDELWECPITWAHDDVTRVLGASLVQGLYLHGHWPWFRDILFPLANALRAHLRLREDL